jgi:hypothetical protein
VNGRDRHVDTADVCESFCDKAWPWGTERGG